MDLILIVLVLVLLFGGGGYWGYRVLRCLAWVATISVWKHEIEFGCEQVNHGFEVAD